REVARQTRLELQHLDLLRRRLRAAGEPLAARRTVRGVGHAHIPWPVFARMARHPPRPLVELDSLERLAHLERSADEPVGSRVTDTVQVHVAFGIHDA